MRHIARMVQRCGAFFDAVGPVNLRRLGLVVERPAAVHDGELDLLTYDTVWDIKTLSGEPGLRDTIQVLMYWLAGLGSQWSEEFSEVTHLGMFNPRAGVSYRIALADVGYDLVRAVAGVGVGYSASDADELLAPFQAAKGSERARPGRSLT